MDTFQKFANKMVSLNNHLITLVKFHLSGTTLEENTQITSLTFDSKGLVET